MFDTDTLVPRPTLPNPLHFPAIDPVAPDIQRPFWSVMIPTLNRPEFVRRAIESVLAEGYLPEEMQICVVDNFTTVADIGTLVQEIGAARVEYFRQPKLQDITTSWNSCIQLSRGHYVQLLHDDSHVVPGFYAAKRALIDRGCPLVFSQVVGTDAALNWWAVSARVPTTDGIIDNPFSIITTVNAFMGNTMVAKRDLYEQVGGYYDGIFYGCDQEITTRLIVAALETGQVGMLDRPYALAPGHIGQSSYNFWTDPGFTENDLFTWEMLISHNDTPAFRQGVYAYLSGVILQATERLTAEGHYRSAFRQAIWAYRLYPRWKTFNNILRTLLALPMAINQKYVKFGARLRHYGGGLIRRTARLLNTVTSTGR